MSVKVSKNLLASVLLVVLQFMFLGVYIGVVKYGDYTDQALNASARLNGITQFYPMFQDVNGMIFVGFGFLMTFLRKYSYGSVGFTFMLACLVIQWAILVSSWLEHVFVNEEHSNIVHIDVKSMITADFTAASILISFGALLGKASPLQLIVIAFMEVVFYAINETILMKRLYVTDVGGSMVIHEFGAYFGLAASAILWKKEYSRTHPNESASYHSDVFAMIGTVFLWMYWPSFNGAMLGPGLQQHHSILNTFLCLCASCLIAFAISPLMDSHYRWNMVHIQNATIAGGVASGTVANLLLRPWGAILLGMVAGSVSVVGFSWLTPFFRKLRIHDTCGVNNLHGIPGLISATAGAVMGALTSSSDYGNDLESIFPKMADGSRTGMQQGGYQFAAAMVTLAMAIGGGLFTGAVARFIDSSTWKEQFEDSVYWEVPEEVISLNPNESHQLDSVK